MTVGGEGGYRTIHRVPACVARVGVTRSGGRPQGTGQPGHDAPKAVRDAGEPIHVLHEGQRR